MRSRVISFVFCALLITGMAGCSKKEQTSQAPPVDQSQAAQPNPAGTPASPTGQTAGQPNSMQAGSGTSAAPGTAPVAPPPVVEAQKEEPPPPPPPLVVPAGT